LTTIDPWQEFVNAFELVAEYDKQRPVLIKENRLYYDEDGNITGFCETNHPPDENYIVLENPDIFWRTSIDLLRVINKELKVLDPTPIYRVKLAKADSGQRVVKGHAALGLMPEEEYLEIEYYDRTNN
jgi:hypothetical protein